MDFMDKTCDIKRSKLQRYYRNEKLHYLCIDEIRKEFKIAQALLENLGYTVDYSEKKIFVPEVKLKISVDILDITFHACHGLPCFICYRNYGRFSHRVLLAGKLIVKTVCKELPL